MKRLAILGAGLLLSACASFPCTEQWAYCGDATPVPYTDGIWTRGAEEKDDEERSRPVDPAPETQPEDC